VVWTPTAERDLAQIWLRATDRKAISAASNRIDALLSRDAGSRGYSVFDTVRELIVSPLGVNFDVSENDRLVYVVTVWQV
jgi:hypothetical protein